MERGGEPNEIPSMTETEIFESYPRSYNYLRQCVFVIGERPVVWDVIDYPEEKCKMTTVITNTGLILQFKSQGVI